MSVRQEIKQQKNANKASLKYFHYFENHRRRQTDFILANNPHGGRICILGAGNCFDVDLTRLCEAFTEVHLVDIDRDALDGAQKRLNASQAKKVFLHAAVDISGANKILEDWRDLKVTPDELREFPALANREITARLPADFDCVVSSCIISQILFSCTRVLGEQHPLLQACLITLLVTHLRLLTALTKPPGRALWITDVTSQELAPLQRQITSDEDGAAWLHALAASNRIFTFLDPELIADLAQQDPHIASAAAIAGPLKTWLWQNGPQRKFLVYALIFALRNGHDDSA